MSRSRKAGMATAPRERPLTPHLESHRPRGHGRALRRARAGAQARPGVLRRQRQPRRHGRADLHAQPVLAAPLLPASGRAGRRRRRIRTRWSAKASRPKRACLPPPGASTPIAARSSASACCAPVPGAVAREASPPSLAALRRALAAGWGPALSERALRCGPAQAPSLLADSACAAPAARPRSDFPCCSRRHCPHCCRRSSAAGRREKRASRPCSKPWRCSRTPTSRIAAAWAAVRHGQRAARAWLAAGGALRPDAAAPRARRARRLRRTPPVARRRGGHAGRGLLGAARLRSGVSLALLFAGQGTQHAAMLPWLEACPEAAATLTLIAAQLGADWRAVWRCPSGHTAMPWRNPC